MAAAYVVVTWLLLQVADGLIEEVINSLARIDGLRVTARTSSFYFKDKNEDARTIGEKLGVAHVLEGSVQKSGDNGG